MPAPKRLTDLIDYTSILPYASEMFGVYQPLLGWKSKRIERRFQQGFHRDRLQLQASLRSQFAGVAKFAYDEGCGVEIDVQPGLLCGQLDPPLRQRGDGAPGRRPARARRHG